jgi:hypothetical protein
MRESRNEALASLWTELALPGADGIVVKFYILSPQRLLQTAAQQSPAFRILLQNALQQFPSTDLAPWNMIVYHDEVTVGNVLRFNNNRKYTAFYFSFRELGLGLRSEFNWLAFAVMRNTTVHKIENGMSNVVRHILRELFLPAHGFMHGVTLNLGTPVLFFATISNVLGDEAALKTTWSSKGAAGLKPCMLCKNVVSRSSGLADSSDYLQDITCPVHALFDCASATDIWALADKLAEQKLVLSKKDFANLEMATGLSHPTSLLSSIAALDASRFDACLGFNRFLSI